MSLDGRDGAVRIRHGLALCRLSDKPLPVFCKCDDRRRRSCSLRVRDDSRLAAFHDRHAAVCRSKVNSDNLTHNIASLFYL